MTMRVAIVGGGPAGLFAAQTINELFATTGRAAEVVVHDRMRIGARKFLLAGRSGLNLTHHEPLDAFAARYGESAEWMRPHLEAFSPQDLRHWAFTLGEPTFVGSTNRVFPESLQATPLLRAWLEHLRATGVQFERSAFHAVRSVDSQVALEVAPSESPVTTYTYDAVVLAMGGASWPRLGGDASWQDAFASAGVKVNAFAASNCGVLVSWSPLMLAKFAGAALKNVSVYVDGGSRGSVRGELTITKDGLEGGPVYALGPVIRSAVAGSAAASATDAATTLIVDLRPDLSVSTLTSRLSAKPGVSLSNRLRRAGIEPAAQALLRECTPSLAADAPEALARQIKGVRVPLVGLAGLDRAISSTGGVDRNEFTDSLMLRTLPGVFCAGEMIDWDAPTGGYLLQACYSTAFTAAHGAFRYITEKVTSDD